MSILQDKQEETGLWSTTWDVSTGEPIKGEFIVLSITARRYLMRRTLQTHNLSVHLRTVQYVLTSVFLRNHILIKLQV